MDPCTIRLVTRDAGDTFIASTTGLNDNKGWQWGSFETKVYDEGKVELIFPNAYGSDAVAHMERFGVTSVDGRGGYRPGLQWVEIYNGADLLYVGTFTGANISRDTLTVRGYDAQWILRKQREYYSGYWFHAPRDVWEHYTSVWRFTFAADMTTSLGQSKVSGGFDMGSFRRVETSGTILGGGGIEIGLNSSNPYEAWQARMTFTRSRFGEEDTPPFGNGAFAGAGVAVGGTPYLWVELRERETFLNGPSDVPGATEDFHVPANTQGDPGVYEVIVEGRERWVYFLVNQSLIGVLPMPNGPATVVPFVSVDPGGGNAFTKRVDLTNMTFRRTVPFLMKGAKGHYHLPGEPPSGGLWGRYVDDSQIQEDGNFGALQFSPLRNEEHRDMWAARLDRRLNFTTAAGYTTEPVPKWQPRNGPTDGLWWSVRWTGSIYLPLADTDCQIQYDTQEEGARLWVGKTRRGEEALDNWLFGLGTTQTLSSVRSHLGPDDNGQYHNGWYPILIEYGQRGTPGAEFVLRYDVGGGMVVVPETALSPYGMFCDQIRADSHYEAIKTIQEGFGYQSAIVPQAWGSGSFPGQLAPYVSVGRSSDKVLAPADLEEYSTEINAEDVSDMVMGDAAGLAAEDANAALTAEVIDYETIEDAYAVMTQFETIGDISFLPLLNQRLQTLMALHGTPWEDVSAAPAGKRELTDTFPLTGDIAKLDWRGGDALRLNLPGIGVVDEDPRQILSATRTIYQVGLGPIAVSFRQRPRDWKDFLRQIQRRVTRKQRTYQGQKVTTSGSYTTPTDTELITWMPLPHNLSTVSEMWLNVLEIPTSTKYIWVNDNPTELPPVTTAGRFDVTAYVDSYNDLPVMKVELKDTPT